MNKLSTQHTQPPAKAYQTGLVTDLDGQQAPGSTLINQLLILDDSTPLRSRSPIRTNIKHSDPLLPSSNTKSHRKTPPPIPSIPTSPNKLKTKSSLQSNSDNCINLDSKIRLQQKYEQALQKLTQLKCHYEVRKFQKYTILNHKSSSSRNTPLPHPS